MELSTFLKWLESLFAAIDVAAPIDERDFPRDQSIPRIQRIRWIRGESPSRASSIAESSVDVADRPFSIQQTANEEAVEEVDDLSDADAFSIDQGQRRPNEEPDMRAANATNPGPARPDPMSRLSITSYPNEAIDDLSGKWAPAHFWGPEHDMRYAKLCYSVLLFRSPRKSNYIISKGKKWFVDWVTGRMVRVLPPEYGEIEMFGPWQVIHTENRRI